MALFFLICVHLLLSLCVAAVRNYMHNTDNALQQGALHRKQGSVHVLHIFYVFLI